MSKVMTFSRTFPAYHPKAGKQTYFVEKIHKSLDKVFGEKLKVNSELMEIFNFATYNMCEPKYHTIRSGNRWKVGDKFSPRVWSGKPYASKQITIAPDIEVKKVWDVEVNGDTFFIRRTRIVSMREIAENDGLPLEDLFSWFNKPFIGQIVCWNDSIEY